MNYQFCGFPATQLGKYLKILVQELRETVVVVEETNEYESLPDGLKERRVGRIVTPGTLVDESWLRGSESRYLLAISVGKISKAARRPQTDKEGDGAGNEEGAEAVLPISLAYADVSTGEFFSKDTSIVQLEDELARIAPREIVLDDTLKDIWELGLGDPSGADKGSAIEMLALIRVLGFHVSFSDPLRSAELEDAAGIINPRQPAHFNPERSATSANISLETQAISLLQHHLHYAFRDRTPYLSTLQRESESAYMHIDAATLQALEIRHSLRTNSRDTNKGSPLSTQGTLLSVLDRTVTDAGHRLLVRTLCAPSMSPNRINARQNLVQAVLDREDLRVELQSILRSSKDVIRSLQRLRGYRAGPDDMWNVALWIRMAERITTLIKTEVELEGGTSKEMSDLTRDGLDRLTQIVEDWQDIGDVAQSIQTLVSTSWIERGDRGGLGDEDDPENLDLDPGSVTPHKPKSQSVEQKELNELARMEMEEAGFWMDPR